MTASNITTKTVHGERTVEIRKGKPKTKVGFDFEVFQSVSNLDDMIDWFESRGIPANLQDDVSIGPKGGLVWEDLDEDEEEKETSETSENAEPEKRGKKEIPLSVVGLLVYAYKQRTSQKSGAKAIQEATDTEEAARYKASAALGMFGKRSDISATARESIRIAQRIAELAGVTSDEATMEREELLKALAAIM